MPPKNDRIIVVFMIIALIAFCIGAGIGVSMSISDDGGGAENNTTHVENVTQEMTTNLNDNGSEIIYDSEIDGANIIYENESNLNYTNESG